MRTLPTLLALLPLAFATTVQAQHQGHTMPGMHHPMPAAAPAKKPAKKTVKKAAKPAAKKPDVAKKAPAKKAAAKKVAPPAHGQPGHDMSRMDHSQHAMPATPASGHAGHRAPAAQASPAATPADAHAGHDMSTMDHSQHAMPAAPAAEHAGHDMSTMDHSQHAMPGTPTPDANVHAGHDLPAAAAPRTPIPALTDADRAAAFPVTAGHAAHDRTRTGYWLFDRLEVSDGDGAGGWETVAWYGGDIHRGWLRTEGEVAHGHVEDASVELLYGRLVSPWWDVVAGVRHDLGEGPSRTWAAVGLQGQAPYKFEVEATAYVGDGGRTAARLEAEYDTLLTNRLILQWRGEADLYGRDDPARGLGSGLSTVEAGARLRYEITRRFAPYVGVEVERAFGDTADLRREDGEPVRDTRVVAGLRLWF